MQDQPIQSTPADRLGLQIQDARAGITPMTFCSMGCLCCQCFSDEE